MSVCAVRVCVCAVRVCVCCTCSVCIYIHLSGTTVTFLLTANTAVLSQRSKLLLKPFSLVLPNLRYFHFLIDLSISQIQNTDDCTVCKILNVCKYFYMCVYVCVCACVRACVRARVCVCVCARARVCIRPSPTNTIEL